MAKKYKYSWNQTLKFSWGHIIAFVALIFISYVTYMGDFYKNGGDFVSAAVKVAAIDVALMITFIGAQITKGVEKKFSRNIVIERCLVCLCPVAFVFAMFSYNHFWNVYDKKDDIEKAFNSSINGAKDMFVAYVKYANDRVEKYRKSYVSHNISHPSLNGHIINEDSSVRLSQKNEYVYTLELQLLSSNTDSLTHVALKWIDEANHDASVWNAFLVGNIKQISDAVNEWHGTLKSYSTPILSNENKSTKAFDVDDEYLSVATLGFSELSKIYKDYDGIKINTLWTGTILFLMLIFPYILQRRNSKAQGLYFLIPHTGNVRNNVTKKKIYDESEHVLIENSDVIGIDGIENYGDSGVKPKESTKNEISESNDVFSGTF